MPVININVNEGATTKVKRLGRGTGNGRGRYCGRGGKGQTARSGSSIRPGFEGGQMPLYRRLPKRGFKNINKVSPNIINLTSLNGFSDGTKVDAELLQKSGLIKNNGMPIKLLGNGELKVKKIKILVNACSASAKTKIESLEGSVEII